MRRLTTLLLLALAAATVAAEIPSRPEELTFPPLDFELPDPGSLRFELANGIPVYAKPDRGLPLISITVSFRGGSYLEKPGEEGLASVTAEAWRTGGAGERSARELDEELDFLAAELSTSVGDVTGSVSLDVLSKDLETGLALMLDVLTRPRFQEDRVAKAKDDLLQAIKTRNDSAAAIEAREWDRLLFGDDFWMTRLPVAPSIEAITPGRCRAFVKRLVGAGNLIVAASGDFSTEELKAALDRTLGKLPRVAELPPEVPQPEHRAVPGVYVVNKPDVNQGRVSIGQTGPRLGHPDEAALRVMNHVLGGGGFTSRITRRVRSDEGLAYSAGSSFSFPVTVPGTFRASFQSKSSTVPFATAITLGLIGEMRTEEITGEELEIAVNAYVEQFPRRFETAAATVRTFAVDELLGRPHDYWTTYRERTRAVSVEDVRRAAARHLDPAQMVILVVGNVEEILAAHPEHEERLADFGEIRTLPLRDPMTLEPLSP